jgi:hypothetical protein
VKEEQIRLLERFSLKGQGQQHPHLRCRWRSDTPPIQRDPSCPAFCLPSALRA